MASVGLKTFLFSEVSEQKGRYKHAPERLAGAIAISTDIEMADGTLYFDDSVAYEDKEITGAVVTLGISEDTKFAYLLGKTKKTVELTVDEETVEVEYWISNVSDEPKKVGFGMIKTVFINGEKKYRVEFYPIISFIPFVSGAKTKERDLDFMTPTAVGNAVANENGDYVIHIDCDTDSEAVDILRKKFAVEDKSEVRMWCNEPGFGHIWGYPNYWSISSGKIIDTAKEITSADISADGTLQNIRFVEATDEGEVLPNGRVIDASHMFDNKKAIMEFFEWPKFDFILKYDIIEE